MNLPLKKWGNSHAVRIPKEILSKIGIVDPDHTSFEVEVHDTQIILTPFESNLTPYQRLMKKGEGTINRNRNVSWEENPEDREYEKEV